jgi:hypothetical protein
VLCRHIGADCGNDGKSHGTNDKNLLDHLDTPPMPIMRATYIRLCKLQINLGAPLMSEATPEEKAFQAACQQVGEFLYHFALLEREIDEGIGKLLALKGGVIDIVTANMEFFRKLKVLFSAEFAKAELPNAPRKKLLDNTWEAITSLNNDRIMVAHYPFSPREQSGVVFRKAVATKKLKVENVEWSDEKFKETFAKATKTRETLHQMIEEMVPYQPKLDFSDPRNSGYLAAIL